MIELNREEWKPTQIEMRAINSAAKRFQKDNTMTEELISYGLYGAWKAYQYCFNKGLEEVPVSLVYTFAFHEMSQFIRKECGDKRNKTHRKINLQYKPYGYDECFDDELISRDYYLTEFEHEHLLKTIKQLSKELTDNQKIYMNLCLLGLRNFEISEIFGKSKKYPSTLRYEIVNKFKTKEILKSFV